VGLSGTRNLARRDWASEIHLARNHVETVYSLADRLASQVAAPEANISGYSR
jgi:hypothetical protein